jgi:hypothetical protein
VETCATTVTEARAPYGTALYLVFPLLFAAAYVFAFDYNGYLDLPEHMARAHVLLSCLPKGLANLAFCDQFTVTWSFLPYFFSDTVLMGSLYLFPPLLAEKVAIFVLIGLFVCGWFVLYRTVVGDINIGYLTGLLLVLNNYLFGGFFAYVLSLSLCMFWIAFWWRCRDSKTIANQSLLIVGLIILFGVHLAGFLFAVLFYGFYELHRILTAERGCRTAAIIKALGGFPLFVAFLGLYLIHQQSSDYTALITVHYKPVIYKLATVLYPFINHSKPIDFVLFVTVLILLVISQDRSRITQLIRSYWMWAFVGFLGLFLIMPTEALGAYDFDARFLMPAYTALFIALGIYCDPSLIMRVSLTMLIVMSFCFNFYNKLLVNRNLIAVAELMQSVPPNASLAEVNSIRNVPNEKLSRVSPLPRFYMYHLLRNNVRQTIVPGLFDCRSNRNMPYFCYRDGSLNSAQYFRHQFLGLPKLSDGDLRNLAGLFNYVLVLEHRGKTYVNARMPPDVFQLVKQNQYAYLFRSTELPGNE